MSSELDQELAAAGRAGYEAWLNTDALAGEQKDYVELARAVLESLQIRLLLSDLVAIKDCYNMEENRMWADDRWDEIRERVMALIGAQDD